MSIRLAAPLALIALVCAVPASAATNDAAANDAAHAGHSAEQHGQTEAKPPAKPRRVCRNETATGSVMPKRVCRTVEQIAEDERRAAEYRDRQNRMGASAR
jgi:hypothetical protein